MSPPNRTSRRRIGEILVNDGIVSQEQIEDALAIQKRSREPLSSILLDMGVVNEADIAKTICVQYQLPFICLNNYEIDDKLAQLLPRELLHQQKILPFDKIGEILLAAVAEVPDEAVLALIAKRTQLSLALYVGYFSEITKELTRLCPEDVTSKAQATAQEEPDIETENHLDSEGPEDEDSDEESHTLTFGSGKGSFLAELDQTWDSIFDAPKDEAGKK